MTQVAATVPIQGLGRELVQNLFVALRSAQLYDARNDTLRAAAERFVRSSRSSCSSTARRGSRWVAT